MCRLGADERAYVTGDGGVIAGGAGVVLGAAPGAAAAAKVSDSERTVGL
jgi:hypothetical protein